MRTFKEKQGEDAQEMFETIKAAVSARQAAERFGLVVNQSGMAVCPFHDDHTPSLKLDWRYYCFGCGASGDVIDFTARLFCISNKDAAEKLAEEFGILPLSHTTKDIQRKSAVPLRTLEQHCLFLLTAYYRLLRFWKKHYAPRSPDEPFHDRFVEGCLRESFIAHLIDEMSDADPWRRRQVVDLLTEDDQIYRLQDYLIRRQEEENNERACLQNEQGEK